MIYIVSCENIFFNDYFYKFFYVKRLWMILSKLFISIILQYYKSKFLSI